MYRFLVATAGPSEADDAFQETWIAALRAYPRLRRADNLRAWLFRIAQNKSIDAHRARGRRAVPVAAVPERASPPPEPEDESLWDGSANSRPNNEPRSSAAACSACRTTSLRRCSRAARRPPGATSTRG